MQGSPSNRRRTDGGAAPMLPARAEPRGANLSTIGVGESNHQTEPGKNLPHQLDLLVAIDIPCFLRFAGMEPSGSQPA
jgi:hypothetical protein